MEFIDSTRFKSSTLLNLISNLSEGIIKLNVNTDTVIKNVKFLELNISISTVFWNTQILNMIFKNIFVYVVTKVINKRLMKNLRNNFLIHKNILTMIRINLFYYWKIVFILMNIWIIEKYLMKYHYLKKKIFTVI